MQSRLQGRPRSPMRHKCSNAKRRRRRRRRRARKMVRFEMRSKAQILRECGLPLCGIPDCGIPECNIPRCGLLNCKLPECVLPESDLAEFLLPNCGQPRCKLRGCHVQPFRHGRKGRNWIKEGGSVRKSARLLERRVRKSARLFEKRSRKQRDEEEEQVARRRRNKGGGAWIEQGSCEREVAIGWGYEAEGVQLGSPTSARGCTSCKLCRRSAAEAAQGVVQRLTELGEENLLLLVLEKLPPGSLLQAARVCRSWARQCEIVFKRECQHNGWALPRHPRWSTTAFPWRSLYFRHACRVCGKIGEFFVRKRLNGNFQFLLCGVCIRQPSVKQRLVQYSIDLYGVSGKLVVRSLSMSKSSTKIQSLL